MPRLPHRHPDSLDGLLEQARRDEARKIRDEIQSLRGAFIHLGANDQYTHGEVSGLYRALVIAEARS